MQTIIIRLIGILGIILIIFLTNYIIEKINELKQYTKNTKVKKALELTENIIKKCVLATNQTFVNDLKAKNKFTKEDAEKALQKTKTNVENILNSETKEILNTVYNDVNKYLTESIETEVIKQK